MRRSAAPAAWLALVLLIAGCGQVQPPPALENRLHDLVCDGELSLNAAQRQEATDWVRAYLRYVGKPPKASDDAGSTSPGWLLRVELPVRLDNLLRERPRVAHALARVSRALRDLRGRDGPVPKLPPPSGLLSGPDRLRPSLTSANPDRPTDKWNREDTAQSRTRHLGIPRDKRS